MITYLRWFRILFVDHHLTVANNYVDTPLYITIIPPHLQKPTDERPQRLLFVIDNPSISFLSVMPSEKCEVT